MPLGKNADAGDYVKDFQKSKAPQFKGKSKEKRQKMAIAAYLDARDKKEKKETTMKSFTKFREDIATRSADKKPETYIKPDGTKGVRMVPADREVVKKEADSDAVKAFLAKGGKIKKLPPGKAAGYHGKDDPGKGMRGMMDRGDTKQLPRKKVRSMEANNYKVQVKGPDHAGVHSVKAKSHDDAHNKVMKKIGQSKLPRHMQPKTRIMGESMQKIAAVQGQMSKINDRLRRNPKHSGAEKDRTDLLDLQKKIVALRKSRNEEVKYPHMMYDPKTGKEVTAKTPADHDKYAKMGYTHEKPKSEALDAKDKPFVSNLIKKLRKGSNTHAKQADDLEKAMKEALKVGSTVKPTKGPHAGHPHEIIHDFGDGNYNIKPKNMSSNRNKYRMGAAKANIKDLKKESVAELSMYTSKKLPNLSYPKKKTKHEKEKDRINMMKKNKRQAESARDDRLAALKKQHDRQKKQDDANLSKLRYARGMKEEMNFAVSIEGLPDMFMSADSPGMLKQTLRKIVKQPSMIKTVKRVTDAAVKKTFRLKAQGREEEDKE